MITAGHVGALGSGVGALTGKTGLALVRTFGGDPGADASVTGVTLGRTFGVSPALRVGGVLGSVTARDSAVLEGRTIFFLRRGELVGRETALWSSSS